MIGRSTATEHQSYNNELFPEIYDISSNQPPPTYDEIEMNKTSFETKSDTAENTELPCIIEVAKKDESNL